MSTIKRYIDCYIPTQTCNLKCHYCYISLLEKFSNKVASFTHSKMKIRKALSKERLGGTCLLNMCAGGETLISEDVLDVVHELLDEGHFVMIVTNGTLTKRFQEITTWDAKLLKHLIIKFSFHYLEFKRLNLFDIFFENVEMMKKSGVSFTVELTPSDELEPYIGEVKELCMEKLGALCHVTIARDDRTDGIDLLSKHSMEEYKKIWGTFESKLFDYKTEIFYKKRKEFCYAGEWSAILNLETGDIRQCYCEKVIDNIYEKIDEPINFEPVGYGCKLPHCYNGHSFLALGDIPELKTPTYAEERNRKCKDGTKWLSPEMNEFLSHKLCENNLEYSRNDLIIKKMKYTFVKSYRGVRKVAGRVKRKIM
ncbi:MAG: radical SAM protein [Lachnospiraceae bacterium]|nr:radical SAM protein [Lachnospiraceae bacterium]